MHSKVRYKICTCSVILGELQSFGNYKGSSIVFPTILDTIWPITKVRHFLIPLSIASLSSRVIENSRQYLLLGTDILQKTVVGCPWQLLFSVHENNRILAVCHFQPCLGVVIVYWVSCTLAFNALWEVCEYMADWKRAFFFWECNP